MNKRGLLSAMERRLEKPKDRRLTLASARAGEKTRVQAALRKILAARKRDAAA